jgi:hypothetical protein
MSRGHLLTSRSLSRRQSPSLEVLLEGRGFCTAAQVSSRIPKHG